ncbi:MAG: glycosyltransferase family 4 protein [Anaerolineae bacterium]|nr:glycosyltransferase family 4 protein [Anaerolineae bacterium]
MRVGFVTGEYPPMEGGIGDVTRSLAEEMVRQGHDIYVFTRRQAQNAGEPGIDVSPIVSGKWGWPTNAAIKAWAAEKRLDVIDVQFQTAAFNMHPSIHWLPGSIRSIPVVVTFHDLRVPYLFPKAGPIRRWIVRQLARRADGVITTNHDDESTLRQWHVRHVHRIPIGSSIDGSVPTGYDRQARRAALGIKPGDLLISYFGFLNHSKGGLVLLSALKQLIEQGIPAHLLMIGGRQGDSDPTNANYAAQVDALIAQHDLAGRIHWTGFVDNTEVSACFHDSDLVALPYLDGASLRRSTLMTALAHGRAIVTTQSEESVPELANAVEMVAADNPEALAGTLLALWKDPGRRQMLEQAAALAAKQFGWDSIARKTIDFFKTFGI